VRIPSYATLARRFASGDTSPSQELRRRLAHLDEVEPKIRAFVHVAREAALAQAAAATERWRQQQPLSPIDGMAIGIKDIIETEDMPTGQGSPIWAGFETRRDSASVQALREAGAVILGKTVSTEFAFTEPLMPVRNPHDFERTAGGSSGGSAAAVGAGILPAALGTQVVGSTLRPAGFCGCGSPAVRNPREVGPRRAHSRYERLAPTSPRQLPRRHGTPRRLPVPPPACPRGLREIDAEELPARLPASCDYLPS